MKHDLKTTPQGFTCLLCSWTWGVKPVSECPGVPRYTWTSKPADLLTRDGLLERGMEPPSSAHRRGVIWSVRESVYYDLYHVADGKPMLGDAIPEAVLPATPVMQPATIHCQRCNKTFGAADELNEDGLCPACTLELKNENARQEAIQWAQYMLSIETLVVVAFSIMDGESPEIIEAAVLDQNGKPLLNVLIRPSMAISADTTALYGITNQDVQNAPDFAEVYPVLLNLLQDRPVLAYDANLTEQALIFTASQYQLSPMNAYWQCAMEAFAAFQGEREANGGRFKTHLLSTACDLFGIRMENLQEAVYRGQAALSLVAAMAQQ